MRLDVPDALLERADRSRYAAKAAGRNCVRGGAPVPSTSTR